MWYQGNYVLADPDLDPSDLYLLTTTIGHPLMALMDYTDMVLGIPQRETSRQASLVTWFAALVALRIADVVDFDSYEGDFTAEQLADYQIEWPDSEPGTEPRVFLETMWSLQQEGDGLNFIDLLLGKLCEDFLRIAEPAGKAEHGEMIHALHLRDASDAADVPALVKAIDLLLYQAGVPLRTERYVLSEEGVGTQRWKALAEGAMSDGWQPLSAQHLQEFLNMRQMPFDVPPNLGHLCDPPFTYFITLVEDPSDD